MTKPLASLLLIAAALILCTSMIARETDPPLSADIVLTERRDVYQTIGLLGQIAFADEAIILSQSSGRIAEVCVNPGQRLAAGSRLVSFDSSYQDEIAAAYAEHLSFNTDAMDQLIAAAIHQSVQRAENDCTIREVYVSEGATVAAGTPVVRVSGTAQEIRCLAAAADADRIKQGMWAWIHKNGEYLGYAYIQSVEKYSADGLTPMAHYIITLAPEHALELEEGSTVEVSVYIAGSNHVVSLPLEAITDRGTVWWVHDHGMCTEIPAEIVLCDETHAWVNLPEGIQVAVGEFYEGQALAGEQS